MAAMAVITLDSFAKGFLLSQVFHIRSPQDLQHFMLVLMCTFLLASAATGVLLTMRPGRRLGLKLMYCIAALPGVIVIQVSWCRACKGLPGAARG